MILPYELWLEYPALASLPVGVDMASVKCPFCKQDTPPNEKWGQRQEPLNGGPLGRFSVWECVHKECRKCFSVELDDDERVIGGYPPVFIEVPEGLPSSVSESYASAQKAFAGANWNPAALELGRVLNDATSILLKRAAPKPLTQLKPMTPKELKQKRRYLSFRIAELVAGGHLTRELGDWANQSKAIRDIAMHGDEKGGKRAGKFEATEILEYTKSLLQYAFVVPHQIKTRKARLKKWKEESPPSSQRGDQAATGYFVRTYR